MSPDPATDRTYQGALVAAIKAEIGGRGWSRKELAQRSGITEQTMERIFNLKRDMNVTQLEQIAGALGIEPDDLAIEARRWRAGTSTGRIPPGLPRMSVDPRSLLQHLLDNPDNDDVLLTRLADARQHIGDKSSRAKRLADEIRQLRSAELERALSDLPPAAARAVNGEDS
jgi:transcriptional regulator with XRE-family HTH domain